MLASILIFSLLASQALAATPLAWEFIRYPVNQASGYNALTYFSNSGRKPLLFARNDTDLDYFDQFWRDPCYERFNQFKQKLVVFWLVDEDVYCETYSSVTGGATYYQPTYPVKNLMRIEYSGNSCPNVPR